MVGNRVIVATRGTCATCKASNMTLKNFVEIKLRETRFAGSGRRGGGAMKTVYLDNNATTQVAPEVLEAMLPYFHELYGNPSSMHSFGGQVRPEDRARPASRWPRCSAPHRKRSSSPVAARKATIPPSGRRWQPIPNKRHIVTSRVEHPAVKALCAHLAKQGYRVTEVPVDKDGILDMEQYRKSLTPDTAVVSLMWANNETGVIFPVEKAPALAQERGHSFSYGCGPGRRKNSDQHEEECGRYALAVRP